MIFAGFDYACAGAAFAAARCHCCRHAYDAADAAASAVTLCQMRRQMRVWHEAAIRVFAMPPFAVAPER